MSLNGETSTLGFMPVCLRLLLFFFFFNATATTEIYTLSLHDALPIFRLDGEGVRVHRRRQREADEGVAAREDRKSTRLNSSHGYISYAVFCLKKKKMRKTKKIGLNALRPISLDPMQRRRFDRAIRAII